MSRLRLLLVFVLVFTAFTVAAQTSFVIERVDAVAGAHIRPAIVRKSRRAQGGFLALEAFDHAQPTQRPKAWPPR
jgi:hypothetical protein